MGYIGSEFAAIALAVSLFGYVKGEQYGSCYGFFRFNAADVKLVFAAVFFGADFAVAFFVCGAYGLA